jgi:hypothetical protein
MNGPDPLTFRILGKTCVIILPPTIDGVAPANDAALEEPCDRRALGLNRPERTPRIGREKPLHARAHATGGS